MRVGYAALLAVLLAAAATSQTTGSADRIKADVQFLADDLLEGRDTGSRGHAIAAAYVASQFQAIGLKPGGTGGSWYVQVPFRRATLGGTPRLALTDGKRRTNLAVGRDAAVRPSLTEPKRAAELGLVFAGYGLFDRRHGLDDYRGLDVRGKIVVVLEGTPDGLPGDVAAHLLATKDDAVAARGGAGLIEIGSSDARADAAVRRFASGSQIDWVDPAGQPGGSRPALRFRVALSTAAAARLFAGAPRSLAEVRQQARARGRPAGFALTQRLAVQADSKWQDFTSPEVIGILPGSDPRLRSEHVVLMGHLDHLGVKPNSRPGEDAIYNGAIDNAAGVATMLEAARRFREDGAAPRRSVLFIANTGEEKGLLGADYFARHPTVPAASIVSAVDLDMPMLLYDFTDVVSFGAEHSTVSRAVADAARSMNIAVSPDPMPQEALFVRSDHYPFVKRGVPAVLLFTGYANGGEARWKAFLAGNYHSVRDDMAQPIHWHAGARYAELNFRIARALANADERPRWYEGDYFGDLFAPDQPKARR